MTLFGFNKSAPQSELDVSVNSDFDEMSVKRTSPTESITPKGLKHRLNIAKKNGISKTPH